MRCRMANERFGGYEEACTLFRETLQARAFCEHGVREFYSTDEKDACKRCALCYFDLQVIEKIKPEFLAVCTKLVENGYISDEFPFYYAAYSYEQETYLKENLNMAEAMYTLYQLALAGRLKETSKEWIREHLRGDGIMAGYDVEGNIVPGKGFESTGVYALAALIGLATGDEELVTMAVARMEKNRIFDSSSSLDGGFGPRDGSGFYSFDQCMSLLAYETMEAKAGKP